MREEAGKSKESPRDGGNMGLFARGWVCAGFPFSRVTRGGGPWRAWLYLPGKGRAVSAGRRGKRTDPLCVERQEQQQPRQQEEEFRERQNKTVASYLVAVVVGMVGLSYASVPLYRLFCQVSGYGGTTKLETGSDKIEAMEPIKDHVIKITFNADVHSTLNWNFRPQQTEIYVVPGETALAFYKAKNPTDKPVIGVSTYNVVPFEAGQYFNKIQCFCFEEQLLNPHEEVDMPVFFYIDPEIVENGRLVNCNLITLSYTFFEAKGGSKLALPGFN